MADFAWSAGLGFLVVWFNFLFTSFNWKDLFGQDLGGDGMLLLLE